VIGGFTRGCGVALCVAAVVTLGLNVFITPFLPQTDFAAVAASQAYLVRQLLAALCAMLLVFGVVGIHVSR
jgi:cytosine/uracil/thiamine/allantoin permease